MSENYQCDEVGLFLFARMFHLHIAVIFNGVVWTTHHNQNLRECDLFLGYKGCCDFVLLRELDKSEIGTAVFGEITEVTEVSPDCTSPAKPKIQRKAVDLSVATDRKKKDKRNKQRRERRKKQKQSAGTSKRLWTEVKTKHKEDKEFG